MEPDLDKLASNKIRQAELRPALWNKDTVWQNVMSDTRRTPRNYYFHYYGAAAAVLLLLLFGIHQIQYDKEPQLTDANRKTQHPTSEPHRDSVVPGPIENNKRDMTDPPADDNETASIMKIQQHFSNNTSSAKGDQQVVQPTVHPLVADLEIKEEEFLLPEEETLQVQKVRPIVGVITEHYTGDVAKAKRKKSLHTLESPETVPWEIVPNGLVFARKK